MLGDVGRRDAGGPATPSWRSPGHVLRPRRMLQAPCAPMKAPAPEP